MAQIYRDQWGIPHIDAQNYADAAKALAYVHSEDDFFTIQLWILAIKGKAGHYDDWDGPYLDMLAFFFEIEKQAKLLEEKISKEYLSLINCYVDGLQSYALENPQKVLTKDIFPITAKDIIAVHHFMEILGIQLDKPYSFLNNNEDFILPQRQGSNVIALSHNRCMSNNATIAISPHQTMEGIFSYYEVHFYLHDESLELHGFVLPCTFTIFMGTNFNIAWGSTASYPEMYNIYAIDAIHKKGRKRYFMLNGNNVEVVVYKYKNYTKLYNKIPLPIYKTIYRCKYGNIVEIKDRLYLIEIPMLGKVLGTEMNYYLTQKKNNHDVLSLMNKVKYTYLDFVFIDKFNNLLYVHNSNEKVKVHQSLHYQNILPQQLIEDTLKQTYYKDNLLYINNPSCGYIVSANQSPFRVTDIVIAHDGFKGLIYHSDNSRSIRIKQLIEQSTKLEYNDIKKILFDTKIIFPIIRNIDFTILFEIKSEKYPKISEMIDALQTWDGDAHANSQQGAIFALMFERYKKYYRYSKNPDVVKVATEVEVVESLKWAKKHLKKHQTLGEIQFLQRGKVKHPIGGVPDAINTVRPYYEKKRLIAEEASAFRMIINVVDHVSLTCHPYGSSSIEKDKNYTSQMNMFIHNQYRELHSIKYYKENAKKNYTI